MLNKIVLAGGTGYLGQVLCDYYIDKANEIVVLSRSKHPSQNNIHFEAWDGRTRGEWTKHLENCDLLVNLCGKNVNCRYAKKNREEIFRSRLEPTALLGKVIADLKNPPKVWINLASATIYRHAEDHYQDEDNGNIGTGFSIEVCKAWEKTLFEAHTLHTKKIALRTGIVLGRRDGVIPRLKNLVCIGMGGKQGNGQQYISWIHEQDFARITEWTFENGKDGEIYNCTSPFAIQNKDFMKMLRKTIGIPFGLSTPQWLLEIGAFIIGTETELILKSRWVYPKRLLVKGYQFLYEKPDHAIHEILSCRV
jgi:uncharacterized protein (TIGR01777 family)